MTVRAELLLKTLRTSSVIHLSEGPVETPNSSPEARFRKKDMYRLQKRPTFLLRSMKLGFELK